VSAAKGGIDEFVVYLITGGGSSGMELYSFFRARPETDLSSKSAIRIIGDICPIAVVELRYPACSVIIRALFGMPSGSISGSL
jgi:hypothetical protein